MHLHCLVLRLRDTSIPLPDRDIIKQWYVKQDEVSAAQVTIMG